MNREEIPHQKFAKQAVFITPPEPVCLPRPLWVHWLTWDSQRPIVPSDCLPIPPKAFAIIVVLSGSGQITWGQRSVALAANSAALVELNDPAVGLAAQTDDWRLLVFAASGCDDLVNDIAARQTAEQWSGFTLPENSAVIRQLLASCDHGHGPIHFGRAESIRLVGSVLAAIYDHSEPAVRRSSTIESFLHLVEEHCDTGLSLSDIIETMAISSSHLWRMCRDELKLTPREILHTRRMRRACELLKTEGDGIAAIAERLGYENASAFGRAFKDTIGLTPSAYRQSQSTPLH